VTAANKSDVAKPTVVTFTTTRPEHDLFLDLLHDDD
jgi:hypothetical protein